MLVKPALSEKYVNKLQMIFQQKDWKMEKAGIASVFDRFCVRLSQLNNDDERDLIIELTNDYLWVQPDMYEEYLLKAFEQLFECSEWEVEENKEIYICPLLPERDFGKIKSSGFMTYLCQSILMRMFPEITENRINICNSPEDLEKDTDDIGALILVDDYIGSGQTALECLGYLNFLSDVGKKIFIISLVAQEDGIKNIRKENVLVFAAQSRKRGISDKYPKAEAEEKLNMMRNISRQIEGPRNMMLGYGNSEGLVSMIKTPNNTFPVYWYENKKYSSAPFVRGGSIKIVRS